jgi:glycosyltransferase involved in cell wall biosynthesis
VGTALIAHPSAEMYGSDRVMLETIVGLVEANWRVVLTTPVDGPLLREARARGAETVVLDVPVLRKSLLRPLSLAKLSVEAPGRLIAADKLLRRLRPDVVYVSTLTLPMWALAGRIAGIPVVGHVHEAEKSAPKLLRAGLVTPMRLANDVVANSEFSLGVLGRESKALARRGTVVYNGVVGPSAAHEPREFIDGTLRVVYVGRLSPRKGVDVAIDAVSQLRSEGLDIQLDIVGDSFAGYEWYEQDLRQKVLDLRLAASVRLHGYQSNAWEFVDAADAVVVPSRTDEPFGNTAVEAVLAARPSVVSRSGGLPEAVSGFESSLLVRPGDADDLALALQTIFERWTTFRATAIEDAEDARLRYSPALYRTRIVRAIAKTAGIGPRRGADVQVSAVSR